MIRLVAVLLALIPALASAQATSRWVVTWPTQATTCAATGVVVQSAPAADFASVSAYVGPITPNHVMVTAPATHTAFRVAMLCGDIISSGWATPQVRTQQQYVKDITPVCWPKPFGGASATEWYTDLDASGGAVYWSCKQADGSWRDAGFYGAWKASCMRSTADAADDVNPGSTFRNIWQSCVSAQPPAADLPYWPRYQALAAKYRPKPAFVVAANGTSASRPAYLVSGGVRTTTASGRVAVGEPCDCAAFKSGSYCSVSGRENVETPAVDQLANSAAICAAP